jgi:simple sugar transport system permease protein
LTRRPLLARVRPRLQGYLVPIGAIAAALLIGAVILLQLDASPFEAFGAMVDGAFGSANALMNTALKATPLLFVGVGITIAFRANVINIGGEGQMVAGALLGTTTALVIPQWPALVVLPIVLLAGVAGGAIWGAIPGALKAYYGVNEILSTIMLNVVAVQLMNFLLRGPLIDPAEIERGTRIPQTERLMDAADLPQVFGRLHIGPLLAVLMAVAAYFLMWRTPIGYRIRAVGLSRDGARYAGIRVRRTIVLAMTLSGALCGLAGAVLVFGSESHRMVTDGSTVGFTGSAGFNGIVAALFGGLHALWTIPASFLFGGLLVGGLAMQRAVQVPSALILALNGLVVVFVVSSDRLRRRMLASGSTDDDALPATSDPPAQGASPPHPPGAVDE